MKNYKKIGLTCMVLMAMCSCEDDQLEFRVDKPESIAFMEYLNQYDDLKTYIDRTTSPNLKLGAGIGMDEYSDKGVMYRLINRNFDEVVVGNEMSHGAVVESDGTLNVMSFALLLDDVQESGLSLYGHALGWHTNQNADYLNALIAPIIIPNEVDNNLLDTEALSNGVYTGWDTWVSVSTVSGAGMPDDNPGPAIRLIAPSTASSAWDANLTTPAIPAEPGKTYQVSFYIRSEGAGKGRMSFSDDVAAQYHPDFETGTAWKEIKLAINDVKEDRNSFRMTFDLGYVADMTYYIDINSLAVIEVNEDDVVLEENMITNSDFEEGNIPGWGWWGESGISCSISDLGQGVGGQGYALKVVNPKAVNSWEGQFAWDFPGPLEIGATYHVKFDVRAIIEDATFSVALQNTVDWLGTSGPNVIAGTEWQTVTWTVTPTVERDRFIFNMGEVETTYYFDNFLFAKEDPTGGAGVTIIEKSDEEKAELIGEAFETWLEGMVTACKEYITAWDVVNEPMSDSNPYELRTGIGSTQASDEFYWQDYLGKDYGVTAFKLARQYGNESDLLFINDNNLEYNLNKCRGLIEYVDYIEKQGARVDGIGTQMHLTVYDSKENIATMFELLAATGKLIKVSELEVTLSVENPTDDDYKAQAEMYRYVVDTYKAKIPVSQQYGITLRSVVDTDAGKFPGLWNRDYDRKRAYAGVANGLAGETVYEEFEFSEETEE